MRFLWIQSQNHEFKGGDFEIFYSCLKMEVRLLSDKLPRSISGRVILSELCLLINQQERELPYISWIRFGADLGNQWYFIGTRFYETHMSIFVFFTFWMKHLAFILWYVALRDYGEIHQECFVVEDCRILSAAQKHRDKPSKANGDAR